MQGVQLISYSVIHLQSESSYSPISVMALQLWGQYDNYTVSIGQGGTALN